MPTARPSLLLTRLLDLVSPRLCAVCGDRLTVTERALCAACYLHLPRTALYLDAYANPMARLFWGLFPVERVAALFYYEAGSAASDMVYKLKYHDRPDLGVDLGRLMGAELSPSGFFDGIDCIVPVPLAKKRLHQRGYNQSLALARGLSRATGLPVCDGAVSRTAFERSQTAQVSRWERQANVAEVFQLTDGAAVAGRHVLLVDDVVTTGATMTACARQLLQAGGVRVSLLSLGFAKA